MNLFIDTNIFLSFYHLSGEDIESLKKLTEHVEKKVVKLFVPTQVREEFQRNRGNKIKDAMEAFSKASFKVSYPAFCKNYDEYAELQEKLKEANKIHAGLLKKAMTDIKGQSLKADQIINELLEKATDIPFSDKLFGLALRRYRLGNPPGKKKSTVGDEMNWEALLESVPMGDDICIVSDDSDFSSPIEPDQVDPYLQNEWEKKKKGQVHFYRSLSSFFNVNLPKIQLANATQTDELIQRLASSGSFATTHSAIASLSKVSDFSAQQVEQLIEAAELNSQIGWIMGDDDVYNFYSMLLEKYSGGISDAALGTLRGFLHENAKEADDLPF
jgi:hypothetical protein